MCALESESRAEVSPFEGEHRCSPPLDSRQRDSPARAGRSLPSRPSRRRSRLLVLEALEERTLLSTFTVNSIGDSGIGSGNSGDLRYVITQADQTQGNNTITFDVTGTITLNSALPDLNNATGRTDVEGPGPDNLTVTGAGSFDQNPFRVFTVDPDAVVDLVGLTITGGYAGVGGGIYNQGVLTVSDATITGNFTADYLGYPSAGAGIANVGTLSIANSTISGNTASDSPAVASSTTPAAR